MTFAVIIKFKDGETLVIERVSDYGIEPAKGYIWVIKNDHRSFYTMDSVKYIGWAVDLTEK